MDWETLQLTDKRRRRSVTRVTDALIGFQHGRCLICAQPITPGDSTAVDHVFPYSLMQRFGGVSGWDGPDLDLIWNLAPAHQACNSAKSDRLPTPEELHRLAQRNEAIMHSPHPLRKPSSSVSAACGTAPTHRSTGRTSCARSKSPAIEHRQCPSTNLRVRCRPGCPASRATQAGYINDKSTALERHAGKQCSSTTTPSAHTAGTLFSLAWHTFSSVQASANSLPMALQSRIQRSYPGSALSASRRPSGVRWWRKARPFLQRERAWQRHRRGVSACWGGFPIRKADGSGSVVPTGPPCLMSEVPDGLVPSPGIAGVPAFFIDRLPVPQFLQL